MNRRQFFGMTAAALYAAGLPLTLLPEKKIFIPPRGGWLSPPLRIREVEQYFINNDSLAMRWDVAWVTAAGEYEQHYILEEPKSGLEVIQMDEAGLKQLRQILREDARALLAAKVPRGAKMVQLKLPPIAYAAYV